ncbi:hypothetical protein GQ44DRAFT_721097 [Phaeosphaeriaceae sp. PMI808]|nr:hypothetical protein GQ44DRAFT_721097 [Phaeosphaeriaceae sp. PMI808]
MDNDTRRLPPFSSSCAMQMWLAAVKKPNTEGVVSIMYQSGVKKVLFQGTCLDSSTSSADFKAFQRVLNTYVECGLNANRFMQWVRILLNRCPLTVQGSQSILELARLIGDGDASQPPTCIRLEDPRQEVENSDYLTTSLIALLSPCGPHLHICKLEMSGDGSSKSLDRYGTHNLAVIDWVLGFATEHEEAAHLEAGYISSTNCNEDN